MLSTEQFSELISVIQTTHDEGPKPEVRRAQRVSHPCRITITLGTSEEAGPAYLVQLKDISARGMCFLHNKALPTGTSFVVRLDSPTGNHVSILGAVVHCHDLNGYTFQIGAEFTCVIGRQEEIPVEPSAEDLIRIRTSILR